MFMACTRALGFLSFHSASSSSSSSSSFSRYTHRRFLLSGRVNYANTVLIIRDSNQSSSIPLHSRYLFGFSVKCSISSSSSSSSSRKTINDPAISPKDEDSAVEKPDGTLKLHSGAAMLPHPKKAATGGEDAYVIEGMWAGVADGVGGWAEVGVDSGRYSRELMANCGHFARLQKGIPNPKSIIIKSVAETKVIGSCTAVLAALHNQTLYVANIGDSGFTLVRDGNVVAKSTPMQREFNFPYQIGTDSDNPSIAETYEVPVASGDVLVLATDGVYDNLYEREIVDLVVSGHEKGTEPSILATQLVKLANQVGLKSEGRTPFTDGARAVGYIDQSGGKLDDSTVVISYIE